MEIWQNLEIKRNTDHDFPPPFMWAENKKHWLLGETKLLSRNFCPMFSLFLLQIYNAKGMSTC